MDKLLVEKGRSLLLGNEAIARGLIEAEVGFASTYPGTPSSEIGGVLGMDQLRCRDVFRILDE